MDNDIAKTEHTNLNLILVFLFSLFPIAFYLGNLIINTFIILIGITYLIFLFKNNHKLIDKKILILLFFFWFTLIINLIFSNNFENSYLRVSKFLFIIFFIFAFKHLININSKYEKYIFGVWTFILIIQIIDIIFEIIFGINITGFKSYMPGRLVSFFRDELVVGYFFFGFSIVILAFLYQRKFIGDKIAVLLFVLLIVLSFLIGERSNFIKTFLSIILFLFFIIKYNYKTKIISIVFILSILISILNLNTNYKVRYVEQMFESHKDLGISKFSVDYFLNRTIYGKHQLTAYRMFEDNKIFGVGIKNFREQVYKKKYVEHQTVDLHPHQIHLELLAETGLFGYISFLIFIISSVIISLRSFIKTRNCIQFSGILFVLMSLLPIIPSGSFFSTFSSSVFWLNYAVMISYIKK